MTSEKLFPLGPEDRPGEKNIEIISSVSSFRNFLKVDTYTLRSRRFNGSMTETYEREILSAGPTGSAIVLLPYDPARDVVVLIEQLRLPSHISGRTNGWTLEPVAGHIEVGGMPEDTARRETLEECGLEVKRLHKVAHYMPSPGSFTELMYLFIGEVEAGQNGVICGLSEEQEDIRSHVIALDDAIRLADEDKIDNANALLAINWLARHREKLRSEWLKD